MRTRRLAVLSLMVLAVAGCANNAGGQVSSAPSSGALPLVVAAGSSQSPLPVSSSAPDPVPSRPRPTGSATETISGVVTAGVEPHCLLLLDSKGSHVLFFDDPALKTAAGPGAQVTLAGHSEPAMMTTCQQGVPFIVTAVSKN